MNIIHFILGILILFFGRRLFWLFVGIAGFLAGVQFGELAFAGHPQWMILFFAIFLGFLGILAALFLERVAFGISGFFAGAYGTLTVFMGLGASIEPLALIFVGGIVGAISAMLLMDWALIFLSGLAGASAIVSNIPANQPTLTIVFTALAATGIGFQSIQFLRLRKQAPK
ncbi:conserved membrane hypothetical protein [uncultured Desulfobacterium sp.]|uniref:DUF4203 domain-containing protein n=1 Tax=uncultured Desulfobacterium sp. TaxID=201089 RepID=A0A445N3U8_9BACT|nr:conserved membrane hypothetical protein [uncultured Desulfobacterium sp.]